MSRTLHPRLEMGCAQDPPLQLLDALSIFLGPSEVIDPNSFWYHWSCSIWPFGGNKATVFGEIGLCPLDITFIEIVVTSQVMPASGTTLQSKTSAGGPRASEIENLKMLEPTKLRTTSHHWPFCTSLQLKPIKQTPGLPVPRTGSLPPASRYTGSWVISSAIYHGWMLDRL